jgi:hypothetical protein
LGPLELGFLWLSVGTTAALMLKLFLSGLAATYRYLFAYLAVELAEFAVAMLDPGYGMLYSCTYVAGQATKTVLGILVVLELYRLALADQPALARFGRRTVGIVLGVAALLAACGLRLDSSVPSGQSWLLHDFLSFERTMDVCVLIFLVLISLFMVWFPVRIKKNVALYIWGFAIYWLARSSGLLLINVLPVRFTVPLGTAMLLVRIGCLLTWLFVLQPEGEETTAVLGHRWNPGAMGRLMDQLKSINASLARLPRS